MCGDQGDGFLASDTLREGFVKPLGKAWRRVKYAEVDGWAVFEGCILLGPAEEFRRSSERLEELAEEHPLLLTNPNAEHRGAGIVGQQFRWPSRTIPVEIDAGLPDPARVTRAIDEWHAKTSIRFRQRAGEKHFLRIERKVNGGCASQVGRHGGAQTLVLADECQFGNVIHELGHTVGLWHEQSRTDRDTFVEILFDNITKAARPNFDQKISATIDLGPYDYGSVMHYPEFAATFAKDPSKPVIRARKPLPPGVVIGQRTTLSAGDIAAVEKMYELEPRPA